MAVYTHRNEYPSAHAYRCFWALFVAFVLYWVARLLSNLFDGLLRRRDTTHAAPRSSYGNEVHSRSTAAETGVVTTAPRRDHWGTLERIASALRDVLLSLAIVIFANFFTNPVTRGFEIIIWIALVVGVIWAVGRGFVKRFADIFQLPFIALMVLAWLCALLKADY